VKKIIALALAASLTGCASWCDGSAHEEGCKKVVAVTDVVLVTAAVVGLAVLAGKSGGGGNDNHPCDYSWQTASDGSRCGGRAADMRPGGR
jgi:hypothetical protein